MPPSRTLDPSLIKELRAALAADRVAHDTATSLAYSRDMWPKTLLDVRDGRPNVAPPDLVVWPRTTAEVAAVVRIAAAHDVPLIPWGAGSGVCGGAMAIHGGIMIDLKRLAATKAIEATDMCATFEAGILGQTLEDELNLHGLTLGHFPSSIYCSTLGGWIATRSAGQMSSRFGKIEDMLLGLEIVLGTAEVLQCSADDSPSALELFAGSEGTLGIITCATLGVRRLAPTRRLRAYRFPSVERGIDGMRRVMQSGLSPAVLRLYDPLDSAIVLSGRRRAGLGNRLGQMARSLLPATLTSSQGPLARGLANLALRHAALLNGLARAGLRRLGNGCLLIAGIEGASTLTEVDAAVCRAALSQAGGQDIGPELAQRWYDERYAVSYKQSPLLRAGILTDTMEVATTWERLPELYTRVRAAIGRHALVLAHFSHAYVEGCSIYFTFAISARSSDGARERYDTLWRDALAATVRAGAAISHHHGVGLSKAAFMGDEHGPGLEVYRLAKRAFDPRGILNPGKMGLEMGCQASAWERAQG